MANVSTKITANTTITSDNSLFFGVIITVAPTAPPGTTIEIYNGTSSSGTHVGSFIIPPTTIPPVLGGTNVHRDLSIKCNSGLRIEAASWTGITVFVLHA